MYKRDNNSILANDALVVTELFAPYQCPCEHERYLELVSRLRDLLVLFRGESRSENVAVSRRRRICFGSYREYVRSILSMKARRCRYLVRMEKGIQSKV